MELAEEIKKDYSRGTYEYVGGELHLSFEDGSEIKLCPDGEYLFQSSKNNADGFTYYFTGYKDRVTGHFISTFPLSDRELRSKAEKKIPAFFL